jgi:hypothetical protein
VNYTVIYAHSPLAVSFDKMAREREREREERERERKKKDISH